MEGEKIEGGRGRESVVIHVFSNHLSFPFLIIGLQLRTSQADLSVRQLPFSNFLSILKLKQRKIIYGRGGTGVGQGRSSWKEIIMRKEKRKKKEKRELQNDINDQHTTIGLFFENERGLSPPQHDKMCPKRRNSAHLCILKGQRISSSKEGRREEETSKK